MFERFASPLAALSLTLACAATASAMTSGKTPQGAAFVSGGVSDSELVELHEGRHGFSLWVVTAARSGAYLADVPVVVRDAGRNVVFEGALDGPWLFVDLPGGRYEVEASHNGQKKKATVVLGSKGIRQHVFYFETDDQVSEDYRGPFKRSP